MNQFYGIKIKGLIGILLATLYISACSSGSDATEYLENAKRLYANGDIAGAAIEVRNALKTDANSAEARLLLAELSTETGNWPAAEKDYRKALDAGVPPQKVIPGLAKALLNQGKFEEVLDSIVADETYDDELSAIIWSSRGRADIRLNRAFEAQNEIDAAMELDPDSQEVALALADLQASDGDLLLARKTLSDFLVTSPQSRDLYRPLAILESRLGNSTKAIEAYSSSIDMRLDDAEDYLGRGLEYLHTGDLERAEADLISAKGGLAKHPAVHYGLGGLALYRKDYAVAEDELQLSLSLSPDFMPAVHYLAVTYFLQSKYEQARSLLTQFLAVYPQSTSATKLLATIALEEQEFSQVEGLLRPLVTQHPDDPAAMTLLSKALSAQGKFQENTEILAQLAQLDPESLEKRLGVGLSAILEGDNSAGIRYFKEAIALDSDSSEATTFLASALLVNRDFDQALDLAQQMIKDDKNSATAYYFMGVAYLGKQEVDAAVSALQQSLELNPDLIQASILLSRTFERQGAFEDAISVFESARKLRPENVQIYIELARLSTQLGQIDAAKGYLEDALKMNPAAVTPRIFLVRYYLSSGDIQTANKLIAEGVKIEPSNSELLLIQGQVALSQSADTAAADSFEKLVRTSDNPAQAHYQIAKAYAQANNSGMSEEHLRLATEKDKQNIPAKLALVRSAIGAGNVELAQRQLKSLDAMIPNNLEVRALRGRLAMATGNYSQAAKIFSAIAEQRQSSALVMDLAIATFLNNEWNTSVQIQEDWLKDHPDDTRITLNLATTFMNLNRGDEAIEMYRKSLVLNPEEAIALNNLARLLKDSNKKEAIQLAETANRLNPGNPGILDTMAVVYLASGDPLKSLEYSQQAAGLSPENPAINFHYAQALVANDDPQSAKAVLEKLVKSPQPFPEIANARALLNDLD